MQPLKQRHAEATLSALDGGDGGRELLGVPHHHQLVKTHPQRHQQLRLDALASLVHDANGERASGAIEEVALEESLGHVSKKPKHVVGRRSCRVYQTHTGYYRKALSHLTFRGQEVYIG